MSSFLLFARGSGQVASPGWVLPVVVMAVLAIAFALILLALFKGQYKRCPSNRILVVYGRSGRGNTAATCVHGGAMFVVPLLQDYAYLTLEPMNVKVVATKVPSNGGRVSVRGLFTVAIGTTPKLMQTAAVRLLGLTIAEICKQAEEIIVGQLRQVIAPTGVENINRDRDRFLENIQVSLEPTLNQIGLVLINVNILDESVHLEVMSEVGAADESAVTDASLLKLLAAFDVSAQQLVARLLKEGQLNEADRREIRRLLDDPSSPP